MWVFFGPNSVKGLTFSILQNYPPADVIALISFEMGLDFFEMLLSLGAILYSFNVQDVNYMDKEVARWI